ncbi:MAG: histidine phosphatase family protein [Nocardioidaceae bacterium]
MLHLVRHGRPLMMADRGADDWALDPAGYDDVVALRDSGRLPIGARWYTSPEPKAITTARLLHLGRLTVAPPLHEQRRGVQWIEDRAEFRAAVVRAFAAPDASASPGWEPLAATRERVVPAVRRLLAAEGDSDLVLVGHGTAWTLVVAGLTGSAPDLAAWDGLGFPGLLSVDVT